MPTSGFDLYHMQDAKNNFNAMRPAPVCTETNQLMGQCQNIHVSTNCYYGYHGAKWTTDSQQQNEVDCEMIEMTCPALTNEKLVQNNARKRSADDEEYPRNKRLKEGSVNRFQEYWYLNLSHEYRNLYNGSYFQRMQRVSCYKSSSYSAVKRDSGRSTKKKKYKT